MSKRFGRNQKRAMREALDNQAQQLAFMQRQRDGAIANQRPLRDALNRVARVLGPHFFGLPAVSQVVSRIEREYRIPRVQAIKLVPADDMAALVDYAITTLECTKIGSNMDHFRGMMHLRLQTSAGDLSYGISDSALQCASIEDLTPEIAHMLAAELRRCVAERAR